MSNADNSRPREWVLEYDFFSNLPNVSDGHPLSSHETCVHVVERSALDAALAERDEIQHELEIIKRAASRQSIRIAELERELDKARYIQSEQIDAVVESKDLQITALREQRDQAVAERDELKATVDAQTEIIDRCDDDIEKYYADAKAMAETLRKLDDAYQPGVERSALDAALAERDQALDRVQKLEQVISNSNESIVGYQKELKQAVADAKALAKELEEYVRLSNMLPGLSGLTCAALTPEIKKRYGV